MFLTATDARADGDGRNQLWQATHFVRVSLKSLGLRVQLGHVPGDKCVHPIPCHGDDFVLLDLSGVHELSLDFCGCEHALPHYIQLLRARWFPATSSDPKTAATFRVLETFQILSVQSKISGWEFYQTLARRTDNTGTDVPKVSIYSSLAQCPYVLMWYRTAIWHSC